MQRKDITLTIRVRGVPATTTAVKYCMAKALLRLLWVVLFDGWTSIEYEQ